MEEKDKKKLTTVAGAPVADNQNAVTAGPRGPMLLQDVWFLEKLGHFNREVIPERRMHAKDQELTELLPSPMTLPNIRKQKSFPRSGNKPRCSSVSPPLPENEGLRTRSGIYGALP